MKVKTTFIVAGSMLALLVAVSPAQAAADAAQAEALLKANKCTKCHDVAKSKSGPAFKKVAEKYTGKADAEASLVKFLTTGPTIKTDDGEEQHKVIKAKDEAETKNLVQWVLSQ